MHPMAFSERPRSFPEGPCEGPRDNPTTRTASIKLINFGDGRIILEDCSAVDNALDKEQIVCPLSPGGMKCIWQAHEQDQEEASDVLSNKFHLGEIIYNRDTHQVEKSPFLESNHDPVQLPPAHAALLGTMMGQQGRVFTPRQLLDSYNEGFGTQPEHTVRVNVYRLRHNIGDDQGEFIQTVRGIGYRAAPQPRKT